MSGRREVERRPPETGRGRAPRSPRAARRARLRHDRDERQVEPLEVELMSASSSSVAPLFEMKSATSPFLANSPASRASRRSGAFTLRACRARERRDLLPDEARSPTPETITLPR